MINNDLFLIFKSKRQSALSVVLGITLCLVYKYWKYYLRNNLGLDPNENYAEYELMSTYFRYFGGVVSIILSVIFFSNRKLLWKESGFIGVKFCIYYLFFYVLLRLIFLDYSFNPDSFFFELPINFSVGFSEEFSFRALIMGGLIAFIGLRWSIILSSVLFSIFHLDVYAEWYHFVSLFLSGLLFAGIFARGGSILILSIFHFMIDQIYFGIGWVAPEGSQFNGIFIGFQMMFNFFLLKSIFLKKTINEFKKETHTVYEENAKDFDLQRSKVLFEKKWLDFILSKIKKNGIILDVGCGSAEPIAKYFIDKGHTVTGIDFSNAMINIAKKRYPHLNWRVEDMRNFNLNQKFDAIIAWNSFFHLDEEGQLNAMKCFAKHLLTGGILMMTVGPKRGEVLGSVNGSTVYHSSLNPDEYEEALKSLGFSEVQITPEDPECLGHTILTARLL